MIEIYLKEVGNDKSAISIELKNVKGRSKFRPSEIMVSAAVNSMSNAFGISQKYAALAMLKYIADYLKSLGVDDEELHETMEMPTHELIAYEGIIRNADR